MRDQPIQLLRDIKSLLHAHNCVKEWKQVQGAPKEVFQRWVSANNHIMKFMNENVWSLEDNASGS